MKKIMLTTAAFVCGCMMTSCEDKVHWMTTGPYEPDRSLAGSVSMGDGYRTIAAEGEYGGSVLADFMVSESLVGVHKVSDTEIGLWCRTRWGEQVFSIDIPVLPVAGKPYDVTFDAATADAKITYNEITSLSVEVAVTGWVKAPDMIKVSDRAVRTDPYVPAYRYEIHLDCEFGGKRLLLKVFSPDR